MAAGQKRPNVPRPGEQELSPSQTFSHAVGLHLAHFISGLLFADLGRNDEALAALEQALYLDPVSAWNSAIAGFFMCELGQRGGTTAA